MESQCRSLGPSVLGMGVGFRRVRWMVPGFEGGSKGEVGDVGVKGMIVRVEVDVDEKEVVGDVGVGVDVAEGGSRRPGRVFIGEREERRVRWISRRRVGIEEAGRMAGREKA